MNLLKNTIDLDISTPVYKFSCKLRRRLTIVHGDSGVGKSSLSALLLARPDDLKVECTLNLLLATPDQWSMTLNNAQDSVIIFDDMDCVETLEFAKLCHDTLVRNNNYLLLICRDEMPYLEDIDGEDGKRKALSISLDEIYNFKTDGINHWLEHDM